MQPKAFLPIHCFYGKFNIFSVKSTSILKKLLKSWFHGNFWAWFAFFNIFPHCEFQLEYFSSIHNNSPNIGNKRNLGTGHNDFLDLNSQMIECLLPTQHCKRYIKIPNRFFVVVIYRLFFNKISRTLNNKRAYGNIFCCFSHMIPSSKWYLQKPHKKALFCGFERKTMKNTKSFATDFSWNEFSVNVFVQFYLKFEW